MVVLITCKNEEDPIKIESARVVTTIYIEFRDAKGQLSPEVSDGIWPKFKAIQAFIVVLVTCKNGN